MFSTTTALFSANAHLVGTGRSYSLNHLQLFLNPEINMDDKSSEFAVAWERIRGVLAKKHHCFYSGAQQNPTNVIELLLREFFLTSMRLLSEAGA